jgi:hypothetical protein
MIDVTSYDVASANVYTDTEVPKQRDRFLTQQVLIRGCKITPTELKLHSCATTALQTAQTLEMHNDSVFRYRWALHWQ